MNGQGIGEPGVFTCGSLQHVLHETIGLALEDGKGIGFVRRTWALASCNYYGRHLLKNQIAISPRRIIQFRFPPCFVLGRDFRGRRIEYRYFRFCQIQ